MRLNILLQTRLTPAFSDTAGVTPSMFDCRSKVGFFTNVIRSGNVLDLIKLVSAFSLSAIISAKSFIDTMSGWPILITEYFSTLVAASIERTASDT